MAVCSGRSKRAQFLDADAAVVEGSIHSQVVDGARYGRHHCSAGLFMSMHSRVIACGKRIAAYTIAVKFLVGPAIMAAASLAVGIQGAGTLSVSDTTSMPVPKPSRRNHPSASIEGTIGSPRDSRRSESRL